MLNRVVCCTSRLRRFLPGVVFCLLLLGCGGSPPPVATPEPEPEPPPPPLPEVVWTARPEVAVSRGTTAVALERPFTRLDVAGRDSTGMLVEDRDLSRWRLEEAAERCALAVEQIVAGWRPCLRGSVAAHAAD